ncbi:hypothetical protein LLEC1_02199 [Akanthomyces lecanii]|uniref:N-acetylglucosaminylphosphatidylinositol deacetylase n=1 Tax=Cordyceps confragosa TaxID=2714763 RepID=A0A179IGE0_CORDF|nr:hypothetical protein LLEC1_02199 [Akanthomyces lecanii]
MDPTLLVLASAIVLVPILYMYTVGVVQTRFPTLQNKRICLLIAHPDDEAMFFAPTVLALTRPETGNHVKILCLSSGNAAGLGETRKKELVKSGMTLGLRDEEDVFVVDNPELASADFPDSMTATWDESQIAGLLMSAFAPNLAKQKPTEQPVANIDVLITFDAHGFTSVLDVLPTLASWAMTARDTDAAHPAGLVFLTPLLGDGALATAWSAMTAAHKSQMVWFRYLYITFSRYMLMNDLQLEKVKA